MYKKPRCPHCFNALTNTFFNETSHVKIGYACKTCKKLFLNKGWEIAKDPLYIGLKKVNR